MLSDFKNVVETGGVMTSFDFYINGKLAYGNANPADYYAVARTQWICLRHKRDAGFRMLVGKHKDFCKEGIPLADNNFDAIQKINGLLGNIASDGGGGSGCCPEVTVSATQPATANNGDIWIVPII
jgi:hypothetical protein